MMTYDYKMQSGVEQDELHQLRVRYKGIEYSSRRKDTFSEHDFLAIRLDGFKHSKAHLKDSLTNDAYNEDLQKSIWKTYNSFRLLLNREYENGFVCACSFTDEVTFVLLGRNTHFDRRIMKYCTLFSGMMSATMTALRQQRFPPKKNGMVDAYAFDARPLILDNKEDIAEYIRHRFLLAHRQAYWKVLRLRDFPGWKTDEIKKNLDNAKQQVIENGWEDEYQQIRDSFRFYQPSRSQKAFKPMPFTDELMQLDVLEQMVTKHLRRLPKRKKEQSKKTK